MDFTARWYALDENIPVRVSRGDECIQKRVNRGGVRIPAWIGSEDNDMLLSSQYGPPMFTLSARHGGRPQHQLLHSNFVAVFLSFLHLRFLDVRHEKDAFGQMPSFHDHVK